MKGLRQFKTQNMSVKKSKTWFECQNFQSCSKFYALILFLQIKFSATWNFMRTKFKSTVIKVAWVWSLCFKWPDTQLSIKHWLQSWHVLEVNGILNEIFFTSIWSLRTFPKHQSCDKTFNSSPHACSSNFKSTWSIKHETGLIKCSIEICLACPKRVISWVQLMKRILMKE